MTDNFMDHDEQTVANEHITPETDIPSPFNYSPPAGGNNTGHYPDYKNTTIPPPPPLVARESAARARMRRRHVKGRKQGGEWAWVIIAGAVLAVGLIVSMAVFLFLRLAQEEVEVLPTVVAALPTPVDARTDYSGNIGTGMPIELDDGRSIILEPWDGESRFTVLAVGLDRRPGETGLIYRTDTMMLISIDPHTQEIGILSIPRDLYVVVPGYSDLQRVNTPMVLGEIQQPGNGPKLAMQTVQYNLGIRVHDYVAVDFNAFITLVDAIGGIDIDTPYTINDPAYPNMYYGYDPFYLPAGQHHLDGATALKYARTRHGDSDFARAERQQQVLYAVRDRILNFDMLPQLIVQAPSLYASLSENVYTGLNVDQMIQLAWYLKDIPVENIRTGVIDVSYARPWTTGKGEAVLIPDRSRIGTLMAEVFGANYSE